jgi:cytochrome c
MKAFGATGAVWTEQTLDKFLRNLPSELVSGTKMISMPVRKETERADLIAFLKAHP